LTPVSVPPNGVLGFKETVYNITTDMCDIVTYTPEEAQSIEEEATNMLKAEHAYYKQIEKAGFIFEGIGI